jgi:hypothetical protein
MFKFQDLRFKVFGICWFLIISIFTTSSVFGQSNRLTNEKGQLLWQYSQNVTINNENPNTFLVTFVFTNGIDQTVFTLRQELFTSQIEWLETSGIQVEKEDRVEFLTANLAPNQSIVFKYRLKNRRTDNEFILEKSALLIMNEDFAVRKEIIPEQRFAKQ